MWDNGTMDFDLIRHLPGMANISMKDQIYNVLPKKSLRFSKLVQTEDVWV